jgi:hypothetical protein
MAVSDPTGGSWGGAQIRHSRLPLRARRTVRRYQRWWRRRYYRSIRNSLAGRRGFVIGNGPSLRIEDLSRLQGDICLAANKIFLAYPQTSWRPQYYCVADPILWQKVCPEVHRHVATVHVPEYLLPAKCKCDVRAYRSLGNAGEKGDVGFSDDLTVGAYGGHTVTYDNLQLAAHLGLNPIYLIGCDHYYAGEKDVGANITVVTGEDKNHFIAGYRQPGEVVNPAPIFEMNRAFSCAAAFCGSGSLNIYNATRGGHLDAFPRVEFDSLF